MNRGKNGGVFQPQSLEIDETIFDRNLKIVPNLEEGPETRGFTSKAVDSFLRPSAASSSSVRSGNLLPSDCPSMEITPDPGFCVKTKNLAGHKVFLNVCKIGQIPPAKPITEEQLQKLIAEEDYTSDYRFARCAIIFVIIPSRPNKLTILLLIGFPCPLVLLAPRKTNLEDPAFVPTWL